MFVRIFLLSLSVLLFTPSLASACKCPQRAQFDIQFEGKVLFYVLGEDRSDGLHAIQFQVEKPIKGVTAKEIKIYSPSVSKCGMRFEAGKHYVVFAHDSQLPVTLPCWGTKEIPASESKLSVKYDLAIVPVSDISAD